jgi:hypothetical protein
VLVRCAMQHAVPCRGSGSRTHPGPVSHSAMRWAALRPSEMGATSHVEELTGLRPPGDRLDSLRLGWLPAPLAQLLCSTDTSPSPKAILDHPTESGNGIYIPADGVYSRSRRITVSTPGGTR